MRALASGLLVLTVFLAGTAWGAEEKGVKEISLTGLKIMAAPGQVAKPTVITSADELAKAFPSKEVQEALSKQVDFTKQQLLFFSWAGSGQDKLTATSENGEVIFKYQRGRTKDLRRHVHLFVLPKDARWVVR